MNADSDITAAGRPRLKRLARWLCIFIILCSAAWGALTIWMRHVAPMGNLPVWITQRPIAHRGLHDAAAGAPENSLAAFERAAVAGYPIETDVHLLADGRLAVFHDFNLKRMTGDSRDVGACTSTDLAALRLGGADQRVPLLEDLFAQVHGRVPILIEIKSRSRTDRRLEKALSVAMDKYAGAVAVQSFNPYSLKWFAAHRPSIARGQLATDFNSSDTAEPDMPWYQKVALRHLLLSGQSRPSFIAYDKRALPAWAVNQKRAGGLPVLAWTVRSAADKSALAGECDNIIFEGWRP
ncbi:MAG: hypothetical protein LLG01_00425 [Planctomycetaceae bacterium]|nr:hypothetical protein [Planctomycetaceae bacterium]